ncbi:response regulator [Sphingorhabdus wooponensis]|jgi:CheY-like chemotaxis protein/DNA-binding MarR family transcriptional regulator|uniref:Response regulator n=1 Tax=Sphingorhabdus wooponensis TaxID=940136 RepID=A0A426RUE6_9SPHN|nr:response regulator [Sphingorhabdus wooponensis]RRQ52679.1 response regulator [Sphingorhabdus wooponensis]
MHVNAPDNDMDIKMASKGCTILLVDDDPACLDEYCDAIANLGYAVRSASSAPDALKQIAESPEIGVVMTDLEMPTMDGISLLSEISNRFSPHRPIVTLLLTAHSDLEVATKAMQSQATDLLTKPVSTEQLAEALRRASGHYFATAYRFQITALTKRLDPPILRESTSRQDIKPTEEELQAFTRMLLKFQHSKAKFFDSAVLTGPSWEILLDITEATLRGEAVPASSASASTHVPLSTALRHVNNLVEAGLVQRWTDPNDKRRTLLKLQPHAVSTMQRYLETAWKLQP